MHTNKHGIKFYFIAIKIKCEIVFVYLCFFTILIFVKPTGGIYINLVNIVFGLVEVIINGNGAFVRDYSFAGKTTRYKGNCFLHLVRGFASQILKKKSRRPTFTES